MIVMSPTIGPSSTQIVSGPASAAVDHNRPGMPDRSVSVPGAGNRLLHAVAKALPDRLWLAVAPVLARKMP